MNNAQKGFTLLEVLIALAIFALLSMLAFFVFSQASLNNQRTEEATRQFNQLQRTLTILSNDLLQWVPRRNRSTDAIIVTGKEAIFSTQSRDLRAPLSEAMTLQTVRWYLQNQTLYRAVRTSPDGDREWPAQPMLEHVSHFSLESRANEKSDTPSQLTLHLNVQAYGEIERQFTLPAKIVTDEESQTTGRQEKMP